MLSRSLIDKFLIKVRASINSNNFEILDSRKKYRQTLSLLGLIENDVLDDICNLTSSDHWLDPENDNNPNYPGEVWQCIKCLHNYPIYIKLKLKVNENEKLLIMSYHIDNM